MNDEPHVVPEVYAQWRASTLGRVTERVETQVIFGLAGPLAGKRLLDVGTGDGTYAIEAAARGALVSGIDSEQDMLDAAQVRAEQRGVSISFQQGRAESLPFGDGAFDVLFAITVLCFVSKPQVAVREMTRVLSPGGRLVLGELNRLSVWAAQRRVRGWLGSSTWKRAHFSSRRELAGLARDAGLSVTEIRGSVFFPPIRLAAYMGAPLEPLLTRLDAPGSAFVALAADKPEIQRRVR